MPIKCPSLKPMKSPYVLRETRMVFCLGRRTKRLGHFEEFAEWSRWEPAELQRGWDYKTHEGFK